MKKIKNLLFKNKLALNDQTNYSKDQLSKLKFLDIQNMTDSEYDKLPLWFQKKYIKKRKYFVSTKRKALAYKYSSKILNKKFVISFINPKNTNIKNEIDINKYVIETKNLFKSYFSGVIETKVLKNLNFKIFRGDIVTILGPSGSGKTTLLNILSALDVSTNGDVFVDGCNLSVLKDKDLTELRKRKVGFIFQQYNLLPNLNAAENIEIGSNLAKQRDDNFVRDVIKTIGLEQHIKKYPYQLSGGQQQRVSIARALAKKPEILFCDEPTGALDKKTGKIVLEVLQKVNEKYGTTIIIVTHNPEVTKYSRASLNVAEGKITNYVRDGVSINSFINNN